MGTSSSPPPPSALRGSRWGHFTGRYAVDFLPAELLPSRSGVEASVPPAIPQISGAGLRCRRVAVLLLPGATSGARRLLAPHRSHQEHKLEGLRQATFRRTEAGPQVRVTIHPSGCHIERPTARHQRREGSVSLEGLSRQQPSLNHDTRRRGVHPSVPAPRSARRISAYSLLRLPRQSIPGREACAVPADSANPATRSQP